MTQSEVPRSRSPSRADKVRAGALSMGAFERGRWRLRRTRHLWVFNRFGDVWNWQFAASPGRECIALHREPRRQRGWGLGWGAVSFEKDAFGSKWDGFPPAWAHVEFACRSTL